MLPQMLASLEQSGWKGALIDGQLYLVRAPHEVHMTYG